MAREAPQASQRTLSPSALEPTGAEGRWTEAHQENIRVLQEETGGL